MSLRRTTAALALVAAVAAVAPAAASAGEPSRGGEPNPLVIGHRGASGYLPEHTLPSYALAIKLGADYIEPDLVSTKDGYLIARHEPNIGGTTDVSTRSEFADRRTTKMVDGFPVTDWFASDFTLAEIKTLRAIQPFTDRPQQFNGRYRIPTLQQVIALAKRYSHRYDRQIGIYPETKHPTFHQDLGLALERPLVRILDRAGWDRKRSPVFIQSFEQSNLKQLDRMTRVRLVQLIDANDVNPDGSLDYTAPFDRPYDWTASGDPELLARTFAYLTTNAGLREVARYADGIGPWKPYINSTEAVVVNPDGTVGDANGDGLINDTDRRLIAPTDLVDRAHRRGLVVHPYTFRNEQGRLASDYNGNPVNEYLLFYELGVDGLFSDFANTAFAARELFWLDRFGSEDEEG
jgi:glycerophosphoryl diester phosphodiesterase